MITVLALLQAGTTPDTRLYVVLGIGALVALVALGLRLFTNMFEVFTTPTASLRHLGQSDNLFFSIVLIFLAGVISTFILIYNQPKMMAGTHEVAVQICQAGVQGNPNPTYQEIVANWGIRNLDGFMNVYVYNNLVFFPIIAVVGWLVLGFLTFLPVRLLGGHTTAKDMLATLAYPAFFYIIALGCSIASTFSGLKGVVAQSPNIDALSIVGGLLSLYALVLWFISLSQGGEIGVGPIIGVVVILLIIIGGIEALLYYQVVVPNWTTFEGHLKTIDPSKTGSAAFPRMFGL